MSSFSPPQVRDSVPESWIAWVMPPFFLPLHSCHFLHSSWFLVVDAGIHGMIHAAGDDNNESEALVAHFQFHVVAMLINLVPLRRLLLV